MSKTATKAEKSSKPPQRSTGGHGGAIKTLADLTPDARNANRHTERGSGLLERSLRQYGAGRSILLDKHGRIIAGNATTEAAGSIGLEDVIVVQSDGTKLVAVQRTDLDLEKDKAARELAIIDNRAGELNLEFDAEALQSLAADFDIDLKDVGFADGELEAMLPAVPVEEDEVPDSSTVDQRCQPGDLWKLGDHRLLCGDSTKADDVARLLGDAKPFIMVTDPPYGVEYDPEWREGSDLGVGKRSKGKVENDDRIDWTETYSLFPGSVAYVWHASFYTIDVGLNLRNAGFEIRSSIIWRKQHFAMSRGHYHWQHEPCWYVVKKGATAKWCGDRTQSTTWEIANNNSFGNANAEETWGHGTQKPVECMARPIRNHGTKKDDVYDPFLGSGTTLIACEQLGRRCFGLEISPTYCDVILARWEKLTGKKAELVKA
jgi:DNA modification methylase